MSETTPSNASDAQASAETPPIEPAIEPMRWGKALREAGLTITTLAPDVTGQEQVEVAPEDLLVVAQWLRDHAQFDLLLSVSGVDWKTYRQSVAHLYSTQHYGYLILKTNAAADDKVPSLMGIWHAADWHERETYDLMGIHYVGHPDLRRILMPMDWLGHPLRKDYTENDPRLVWNRR